MNVLIVDDEPLAQDVLETYIKQLSELNLVRKCNNAIEAMNALQEEEVDLMLLDIEMPQLTGTEFLKTLKNPPLVIFTTAYPNFAIEGFELNAVDYLLKPISLERFLKGINKAKEQLDLQKGVKPVQQPKLDYFFVKADKKLIKVNYSDIIYIEGLKDYVIIKMEDGRVITLQTMKLLESKLPSDNFQRIHRSYIVNIKKIKAVVGNMVEVVEKGTQKHIPIGKNYRERIYEVVNQNRL